MGVNPKEAMAFFLREKNSTRDLLFGSLLVGIFTGVIISLFRYGLLFFEKLRPWIYPKDFFITHNVLENVCAVFGYLVFFIFLAKFLAALMKFEPNSSGSGVAQVKGLLAGKLTINWGRVLLTKLIGSLCTIGFGMSLGKQAPSMQLGACIGQGVAEHLKKSETTERIYITAGAGAAVAAMFNAPLAGMIFCIEELTKSFSSGMLLSTMVATVSSTMVAAQILGNDVLFNFSVAHLARRPLPFDQFLWLIPFGILAGILGVLFQKGLFISQDAYQKKWSSILNSPEKKLLLPLLFVGLFAFTLPEILSSGDTLIHAVWKESASLNISWLTILLFGKFFFTLLCFGSNAQGSIFLPVLTLGALFGSLYAKILISFGCSTEFYAPIFLLYGMAALLSAVFKTPITAGILIAEMTGSSQRLLGLLIVTLIADLATEMFQASPTYDALFWRSLKNKNRPVQEIHPHYIVGEFLVEHHSKIEYKTLRDAGLPKECLIVSVQRLGEVFIPRGNFQIQANDLLCIAFDSTNAHHKKLLQDLTRSL